MIKFVINYWNGKLAIGSSFWLVFLGLIILLSVVEPLFLNTIFDDPKQRINATFVSLGITRLLVFPWQLVGLIRVVDREFIKSSNTIKTRLIQSAMILSVLFTFSYSLELIQDAYSYKNKTERSEIITEQPAYTLSINQQSQQLQQLQIKGDLDIGITKAVSALIKENKNITSVLLESDGGHIYEGRGLSKLFTQHELDTIVEKQCSSACASAFIGGKKRYLGKNAKLGFHQYKLDYSAHKKLVPFHKPEEEQVRDLELFKSRGITTVFLDKVFAKKPDQMWFPSHTELLEAKVIHSTSP
ncbi:hypothetical protein [uncultured Cocleimonas sp.]|uniref:hypothetical protein n=1 Tax=uncultured Cocleimonas sp. TaxID=1051587 RepID=UPI00262E3A0C|nr:hypothetical protein [uncultured Cocleimonas sp.]